MRIEMKTARKPKSNSKGENATKSISMPIALWLGVESRVEALKESDPDLDFSKYVRRLIRRDVETQK